MIFPRQPLKLVDCSEHGIGSGAELYVVEGDSAAGAVARLRNERYQAVLPMQGKPLNTLRVSGDKVVENRWFRALIDALGTGIGEACNVAASRFDRVILLMDPDADGIHCSALAQCFFYKWMRPIVDAGRLGTALAPLATVEVGEPTDPQFTRHHMRTEPELRHLLATLAGRADVTLRRYRGLAGTDLAALDATCLDPTTRLLRRLTTADAEAMIAAFGR